jgi:hypothetical protein
MDDHENGEDSQNEDNEIEDPEGRGEILKALKTR